jgi:hypothetical protein
LRRAKTGIHFIDHFEGDGAKLFAHACELGLEGIVSKDRTRSYRSGRSKTWLKIKEPSGAWGASVRGWLICTEPRGRAPLAPRNPNLRMYFSRPND